jgi:hypothetical protein
MASRVALKMSPVIDLQLLSKVGFCILLVTSYRFISFLSLSVHIFEPRKFYMDFDKILFHRHSICSPALIIHGVWTLPCSGQDFEFFLATTWLCEILVSSSLYLHNHIILWSLTLLKSLSCELTVWQCGQAKLWHTTFHLNTNILKTILK